MKLIKFNPDNKPFYSTEFIKGFEIGARRQFEADSAERKGKWMLDKIQSARHIEKIYICSNCNNYSAWGETERIDFKFCPNCGADMRGEEE